MGTRLPMAPIPQQASPFPFESAIPGAHDAHAHAGCCPPSRGVAPSLQTGADGSKRGPFTGSTCMTVALGLGGTSAAVYDEADMTISSVSLGPARNKTVSSVVRHSARGLAYLSGKGESGVGSELSWAKAQANGIMIGHGADDRTGNANDDNITTSSHVLVNVLDAPENKALMCALLLAWRDHAAPALSQQPASSSGKKSKNSKKQQRYPVHVTVPSFWGQAERVVAIAAAQAAGLRVQSIVSTGLAAVAGLLWHEMYSEAHPTHGKGGGLLRPV